MRTQAGRKATGKRAEAMALALVNELTRQLRGPLPANLSPVARDVVMAGLAATMAALLAR